MAIIFDQITVGDHLVFSLEDDPRTGAGTPAIVGTIAMVDVNDSGISGEAYLKVGVADTAWRLISTSFTAAISVEPGDFRHLAVYKTDSNGDVVNDEFDEANGGTISVEIEGDSTRTANMEYRFPKVPGTIVAADVVLTESDQTINGDKTFNDNIVIQGSLDVNGTLTSIDTVNTTILDSLITLNKGGAATSAGGSGIELEENSLITGYWKTSADREKWCMKAPALDYMACFDLDKLTADRDFHFPDASGTLLLQPTTPSGVANQVTWWLNGTTVTAETGTAPNALTWDDTNNFFGVQTATPKSILHVGNFTTAGAVGANAILLGQMDATAAIGAGAILTGGINGANKAEGTDSFVGGIDSSASGAQSMAVGDTAEASATNAQAFGLNTIASGAHSSVFGSGTTATAASAFAQGTGSSATAANAHAEGLNTSATAIQAHAEGNGSIASGAASHAEGNGTIASFANAHAEGLNTSAIAIQAHAEGSGSIASGDNSHAEGDSATASGESSHAQGKGTTASGSQSHAEGLNSIASGLAAHAQGQSTASGNYSFAGGLLSVADGDYSIALGRKAQSGGFAGVMSLSDSQDFTSSVDAADRMKMRFNAGWDLVKGGGADDDDGVNFKIRQAEVATIDATVTTLQSIPIPTDTTVMIKSKIIGVRTGGTAGDAGDSAGYERTAIYKNISGTVTVHKKQSDYTFEDQKSWKGIHAVSGTNAIIQINGAANNNVQWEVTSYIQTVEHS